MWSFIKKKPTIAKRVWLTVEQVRRSSILDALSTVAGRKLFTASYATELASRRNELEKAFWRVAIFNILIAGILFLNSSLIAAEFTIGGISFRQISPVKEILLFVSSTLVVIVAYLGLQVRAMNTALSAWLEKTYSPGIREVARLKLMGLPGEAGAWPSSGNPSIHPASLRHGYAIVVALALIVWLVIFILATFAINIIIIVDTIRNPNFPPLWSWMVVAYAIAGQIISTALSALHFLPLPYTDYTDVMKLVDLEKRDPVAYLEERRRAFEEAIKRQ
jgi:hypothetical protein